MDAGVHYLETWAIVIKVYNGRIIRRHQDHVRIRSSVEVSQDNIPNDNMILYATVPVDTPIPISIVSYQPITGCLVLGI